jgi:hypothetical protein
VTYRLADKVQVRKESWGLLFYRQTPHKMCFVRSGDWLYPSHFDGTWTEESIIDDIVRGGGVPTAIDIVRGGGVPAATLKRVLTRLIQRLTQSRLIIHEVR